MGVFHALLIGWVFNSVAATTATNPYQQGCLYSKNLTRQIRVCGSEDPLPEAVEKGWCRMAPIDYPEIRIIPGDWESIALQEMLFVPASVEMGSPDLSLNLYHPDKPVDYHADYRGYTDAFALAYELDGDCSKAQQQQSIGYQQCGHFLTESWLYTHPDVQNQIYEGILEPPQSLGMLAQESWFVPKFTAQRDPTLLSYLGLQGDDNRQKLADSFKRPTTWHDYCEEVSRDNCTWRSPVPGQLHYLEIPLDNDMDHLEYSYSQQKEIWMAANATKSDVIMMFWKPEKRVGTFLGTDAEFVQVSFPPPTVECLEGRPSSDHHCSADYNLQIGTPENICGEPAKTLKSLMSTTVFRNVHDSYDGTPFPKAVQSPSHSALQNFQFSELQVEEVFQLWNRLGDPRDAVCEWVADNMDFMHARFIPRTYPRAPLWKSEHSLLMYASTIIRGTVLGLVLVTTVLVQKYSGRDAMKWAQIEFLNLLLGGSFLIALGAILLGAPSTDASCTVEIWLMNLGYTLELCPLIVKVAAVNHVLNIGQQMRRISIRRDVLYGVVILVGSLVVIFFDLLDSAGPAKGGPRVQPFRRG
ncbi:unknown protein [Seminavis robusta]|uniref:G-protein coupled receptors family 3 profile domain-containing protein n=1 Tax=Seminavis robusta TaxID=568900 RepID=A0A9N8I1E5_9STRA|nr:unknown protein [Seminavis robusta]|eukprot:Sro3472_g348390.1 n/a (583) ;mRNA; r:2709-4836